MKQSPEMRCPRAWLIFKSKRNLIRTHPGPSFYLLCTSPAFLSWPLSSRERSGFIYESAPIFPIPSSLKEKLHLESQKLPRHPSGNGISATWRRQLRVTHLSCAQGWQIKQDSSVPAGGSRKNLTRLFLQNTHCSEEHKDIDGNGHGLLIFSCEG